MSKTKIEWCHRPGTKPETWNPTTGCNKVSQGCKNCYAEIMHKRLAAMGQEKYRLPFLNGAVPHVEALKIPFTWKTPRTVFVNSMSDLFHENVPKLFLEHVFTVMALTPQHTYIILTKRHERMMNYMTESYKGMPHKPEDYAFHYFNEIHDLNPKSDNYNQLLPHLKKAGWFWDTTYSEFGKESELILDHEGPLPNVWIGVSVEDQKAADERIPLLLQTPAAVRFLSCEPLLGPVNLQFFSGFILNNKLQSLQNGEGANPGIHQVICGGESGHKARPMHPDWARSLRDQCEAAAVPFFFKQWGEYLPFEADAQPPFYNRCDTGESFDSHAMNIIDPETSDAGKWNGHRWYDSFDAMLYNNSDGSKTDVMYWKCSKHAAGRLLDGKEYNGFPV